MVWRQQAPLSGFVVFVAMTFAGILATLARYGAHVCNEATVKKISLLLAVIGLGMTSSVMAETTKSISPYPVGQRSVLSQRAVADRVKPVGEVCVEGKACNVAAAAAAPAAAAGGGGPAKSGEQVFSTVCTGCHSAGVMGAPKFGDKADWAPRIAKGADTLHQHALQGYNGKMPARGTCMSCSDAEVIAAVDYMISKAK